MKHALVLAFFSLSLSAQTFGTDDPKGESNYVVIGAFAIPQNAVHFAQHAKKSRLDAQYALNPARQLHYVYVLHTGDRQLAIQEALKLRSGSAYADTWVYSGALGDEAPRIAGRDINPLTTQTIGAVRADDKAQFVAAAAGSAPVVKPSANENAAVARAQHDITTATVDPAPSNVAEVEAGGKAFYFKVFRSGSGKPLEGDIDVMDAEKQKKVASYKANQTVQVRPAASNGMTAFQCEVFGYRKVKQLVDFNNVSMNETLTEESGVTTVPFELVRLKKGDIAVMYNVYFFKDAAVMRPESRYEVNSLKEMLDENPKYKIRIHGHTNGNASGKIIQMGDSKNFFSLSDTKDAYGSAKKLSEQRAAVIRDYLVAQGIHAHRLHVKAWGGKKPVYDKLHALAQSNVRVEIEIVED
jgi:outer membrane protein OmpA-like peptidoglycan-associated protein